MYRAGICVGSINQALRTVESSSESLCWRGEKSQGAQSDHTEAAGSGSSLVCQPPLGQTKAPSAHPSACVAKRDWWQSRQHGRFKLF